MYLPSSFAENDLAALDYLIELDPFVTVITHDAGVPFASHVPVLYRRDHGQVLIEGHFARPNPQCAHAGPVLLIVHGPNAYVSPSWYVDKDERARVPTWNYAVAHVRGELEMFTDTDALADLVSRLSDRHEAMVGQQWRFEPARADHRDQLQGIVGFRLLPTRIDLKFKLNQNHPAANVRGVVTGLRDLPDPGGRAVAELMLDRLLRRA